MQRGSGSGPTVGRSVKLGVGQRASLPRQVHQEMNFSWRAPSAESLDPPSLHPNSLSYYISTAKIALWIWCLEGFRNAKNCNFSYRAICKRKAMEAEKWVVENNRLRLKGEQKWESELGQSSAYWNFPNSIFPTEFNFSKGGKIKLLGFCSYIDIHSAVGVVWAIRASWPGGLDEAPLNSNQPFTAALYEEQETSVPHNKESVLQPESETALCLLKTLQSNPLDDQGWSLSFIGQCIHRHTHKHGACLWVVTHSHLQIMGFSWAMWLLPLLPYPLLDFN